MRCGPCRVQPLRLRPATPALVSCASSIALLYGFQLTNLVERLGYDPREDLKELARLAARGELKVHVDVSFPLAEAAEVHRHMEGRRNRGKVILETSV